MTTTLVETDGALTETVTKTLAVADGTPIVIEKIRIAIGTLTAIMKIMTLVVTAGILTETITAKKIRLACQAVVQILQVFLAAWEAALVIQFIHPAHLKVQILKTWAAWKATRLA